MVISKDSKPVAAYKYSVISRSRQLIAESNKLFDKWQKIIDDETAKRFERAAARRQRRRR